MKMTVPPRTGGTKVAIDWPNMCESGSRFRNRIGENGLAYFRYFRFSTSPGTVFVSTVAWGMTTPLGASGGPDGEMFWAISAFVMTARGAVAVECQSTPGSRHRGGP